MIYPENENITPVNNPNEVFSRLNRKLDESTDSFKNFIEQAPVAVAIVDLNGIIEYINISAQKLFGYQISDINNVDNWWLYAYPDEDYRREVMIQWNNDVLKALNNQSETEKREFYVTCKDGTVKVVNISMVIITNRILILFEDITERKNIEKALYESEQHYKMVTELTTDYVFRLSVSKDSRTKMDFISDNFLTITGRTKEQSNIEYWNTFIHPEDLICLMAMLKSMMAKPQFSEIECRSYIHGNHLRWVTIVCRSEWDEKQQRIVSITGAVKDISERKRAELEIIEKNAAIEAKNAEYARLNEQLLKINRELTAAKEKAEESDHLKTAFLQNMSHEIRTPMNAIMGFASILKDNFNNKQKLENFCEIINSRCYDLLEIINDLLDISKIESGQSQLNIEECNLVELFSELNMFFKEQQIRLNKAHIDFNMVMNCGTAESLIMADILKLKQIFINLISNAFKFTDHGSIHGGCKFNETNQLIFYVTDTGIGIPPEKHDLIFERFMQLGDGRVKSYGGTGLGLAIVKGLINIMGGKVWIESEVEDQKKKKPGRTTFYFTFPFKEVAGKAICGRTAENN
jgi:PAS domain S-box-containing protein